MGEYGKYNENYHIQVPRLKVQRDWYKGLDPKFMDEQVRLSMFDRQRDKIFEERIKSSNKTYFAKPDDLNLVGKIEQITYPELKRRLQGEDVPADVSVNEGGKGGEEAGRSKRPNSAPGPYADDYIFDPDLIEGSVQMDRMHRKGRFFDDDYFPFYMDAQTNDSNYVYIDPHVLSTPTLADINGDGKVDVIMAVSYYFDKKSGSSFDFEPDMYVAGKQAPSYSPSKFSRILDKIGGVVCWDLENEDWAWMVHLDLTTDRSSFKALIFGSPTVADLDGDGRSEVIIGTSLGLLYVLDGDTGFTRRFFPMQFHEIEAQVAVADVVGGPDLEIIVCDMGGNVVVVDVIGSFDHDHMCTEYLTLPSFLQGKCYGILV